MRKKVIYWMLALFVISSTSMNAQVIIGSLDDPHPGAALEVKSVNANPGQGLGQGLLLPRFELQNVTDFQLKTDATHTAKDAVGMIIFNTNASITGGNGTGIYVWDGAKWSKVNGGTVEPTVPVTNIAVSFVAGVNTAYFLCNTGFQATVSPANATDQSVTWSVTNGSGSATIDPSTGVLYGLTTGTVTVTATSTDGSNVTGSLEITIDDGTTMVDYYKTYTYGSDTWMVENIWGIGTSLLFRGYNDSGDDDLKNGYYYSLANLQSGGPCVNGWHMPTKTEFDNLMTWVNANPLHYASVWWLKSDANAFAGFAFYYNSSANWSGWDETGYWWCNNYGNPLCYYAIKDGEITADASGDYQDIAISVRCVKDKN